MRALDGVAVNPGAAAGLDVEQLAQLHAVGIEMLPMNGLRLEQEVVERQPVKRPGCLNRPIRRGRRRAHRSRTVSCVKHSQFSEISDCGKTFDCVKTIARW